MHTTFEKSIPLQFCKTIEDIIEVINGKAWVQQKEDREILASEYAYDAAITQNDTSEKNLKLHIKKLKKFGANIDTDLALHHAVLLKKTFGAKGA